MTGGGLSIASTSTSTSADAGPSKLTLLSNGNGHGNSDGHGKTRSRATSKSLNGEAGEGARTPRPRDLTPSPTGTRGRNAEDGGGLGSGMRYLGTGVEAGPRLGSTATAGDGHGNENGEAGMTGGQEGSAGDGGGGGGGDAMMLMRTLDFAARKHSSQRRKDVDQSPYINHPIAVANYLSSTGVLDVRVLQAAILHDTVEDTSTTLEELVENFGAAVAKIVEECTDNPDYGCSQRKAEQVRTAPNKSKEAKQVKLADKLHNLESVRRSPPVGWGIKRIQAYFIWAKQVTDICGPAHPPLAAKLQHIYETAYTRVNGKYYPCHPEVAGPMTDEEKAAIDSRLKAGDKLHPNPIFF